MSGDEAALRGAVHDLDAEFPATTFREVVGADPGAGQLYAILDAAAEPTWADRIAFERPPALCLYVGELSEAQRRAAPYLVAVDPLSELGARIFHEGFGAAQVVYLRSPAPLGALARYLETLLTAVDPAGTPVPLRFFDPRVLRVLLPLLDPAGVGVLFGAARVRGASGELRAACPVCTAAPAATEAGLACRACAAAFAGDDPPALVALWAVEDAEPGRLRVFTPGPAATRNAGPGARRLAITPALEDALFRDYAARQGEAGALVVDGVRDVPRSQPRQLEVEGLWFRDGTRVAIGGRSALCVRLSASRLRAQVPSGLRGRQELVVTDGDGRAARAVVELG